MNAPFRKIAIIGLGLIGSSVARAARRAQLASSIVGIDSNEVTLGFARKGGFVDQVSVDAAQAVAGCDAVIIATPTHLLADICALIAPALGKGALVMDTGSVKQLPLAVMTEMLPAHALIVPAHPIAGSEKSGVAAGSENLFVKKRVIITPDAPLSTEQLQRINQFWTALGARVEAMPAPMHDTLYGYVSHLPQLLAFAAAEIIQPDAAMMESHPVLKRFMRLSVSNTALWQSIFLLNHEVLATALGRYIDVIAHIEKELNSAPQDTPPPVSAYPIELLFARIVSSCLVTTVMEAEKKAGINFARYSGSGFADFTSPTTSNPEGELEHISGHYQKLLPLLAAFKSELIRRQALTQ